MTLHPQARALLDELGPPSAAPESLDEVISMRAEARRAAFGAQRVGLDHVVELDADGVACRLYRPCLGAPVALYVHGGGWVFHDLETHDVFCRYVAHATGWALLSVDYRLAPEHAFPAGLDDLERAGRWLREHGRDHQVDATWLPGIGDSSGANLLAGLAVRDSLALDALSLIYPPTDRRADLPPERSNGALSIAGLQWMWEAYAPGRCGDHPEVSVLRAPNLADLPPTFLVTAEHDVLCDQGEQFAVALAEAGVDVTAQRMLGMVHSFWRRPERFEAARALVLSVGAWLDGLRGLRDK